VADAAAHQITLDLDNTSHAQLRKGKHAAKVIMTEVSVMKKKAITEPVPSTPAHTRRTQQKLIVEVVLTVKKDAGDVREDAEEVLVMVSSSILPHNFYWMFSAMACRCLFPSQIPALDALRVRQLALVDPASTVRPVVSCINLAHICVLVSFTFSCFCLALTLANALLAVGVPKKGTAARRKRKSAPDTTVAAESISGAAPATVSSPPIGAMEIFSSGESEVEEKEVPICTLCTVKALPKRTTGKGKGKASSLSVPTDSASGSGSELERLRAENEHLKSIIRGTHQNLRTQQSHLISLSTQSYMMSQELSKLDSELAFLD
jgi:hypothetical protein